MDRQRGFTLIETVFVITLMGVIASLGILRFSGDGKNLSEQLAAQDLVYAELQRARDESVHQSDVQPSGSIDREVTADLQGVLDERFGAGRFSASPTTVGFSYIERGAVHPDDRPAGGGDLAVRINPQQSDIRVCVAINSGRAEKGACE